MMLGLCLYVYFLLHLLFFVASSESFRGKIDGLGRRSRKESNSRFTCNRSAALKQSIANTESFDDGYDHSIVPVVSARADPVKTSGKSVIANIFGYVIGAGSLTLYLPILVDIIKRGNTRGVAMQTWIANAASFSLALIYPIKKKFALSTYVELLALGLQSFIILATICFYNGLLKQFAVGAILTSSIMFLIFTKEIPEQVLSSIQICRVTIDTFTLLPQILLNFSAKSFRYSLITLGMSIIGNLMRVFTTMQLVKDNLVLAGYLFGLLNAFILLVQYFVYGTAVA